jgi:hypothetical protein
LGIKNPSGFLLDELAQKSAARLELSAAINAGLFDDLFDGFPKQRAEQAMDGAGAQADVPGEPAPALGPDNGYVTLERPMLAGSDWQGSGGWREVEVLPPRPEGHVIRSHRRKNHYLARVRRFAAVAALAIGVWLVGTSGPTEDVGEPTPEVVFHDPQVIGEPATAELPPIHKPPADVPVPVPQPEPPADHIVPLGTYDPAARTGAIWFAVEDYAAQLGHPGLTLLQTHLLTDKCIQYMNTKLPGGMSWDQAMHLPSDIQLPYPPSGTMEEWIKEVKAQTGTSTAV